MPTSLTNRQAWILAYLAERKAAGDGASKPNPIGAAYFAANLLDRSQASPSALACASLKRLVKDGLVKKTGTTYEYVS